MVLAMSVLRWRRFRRYLQEKYLLSDYFGMRFNRAGHGVYGADPTPQFWEAWHADKPHMRSLGFRPTKTEDGWCVIFVPPDYQSYLAMEKHCRQIEREEGSTARIEAMLAFAADSENVPRLLHSLN